jgi:hypothetical protein
MACPTPRPRSRRPGRSGRGEVGLSSGAATIVSVPTVASSPPLIAVHGRIGQRAERPHHGRMARQLPDGTDRRTAHRQVRSSGAGRLLAIFIGGAELYPWSKASPTFVSFSAASARHAAEKGEPMYRVGRFDF